jgi:cobalamin biosynthesis Co2+ chelatase CbiK
MKTNTSVAIDKEVWQDFGRVAIIKGKTRGEILESLIKREIKENDTAIRQLKEVQANN